MSASTLNKDTDLLDVTPTREIYPMTSMQETVEFLYDKVKQLGRRVFQASESVESLAAKVEELSTSIELSHQKLDELSARADTIVQPQAPCVEPKSLPLEQVDEFGLPIAPTPTTQPKSRHPEPEPQPAIHPEESDPDSDEGISPCLWGRVLAKFKTEPEPESDIQPEQPDRPSLHFRRFSEQQLASEPNSNSPQLAKPPSGRFKRRSLCMLPPDEMQDVMLAISPDPSPMRVSPDGPAPSPASQDNSTTAGSLFLR
jgi:hypothetical protein